MAKNQVRIGVGVDDKATRPIRGIRDAFQTLQREGGKGLAIGVGAAATSKAFDLLGSAVRGVTDFIGGSVKAASDLNEQMSKTSVVFGASAAGIQDWASKTSTSFGISKRAALEAAGGFGTFFTGAGQSQDAAADMSQELVELGADLASFNNLDPTDVLDKLRSGLSGEAEPLRRVGVFLTEAKVKAKAFEMGLGNAHGELTEGEKILARYQIILDETGAAQGDFARTSDGLANTQRSANARLEDSQARIGASLERLATVTVPLAADALEGLLNAAEGLGRGLQDLVGVNDDLWDSDRKLASAEDEAAREALQLAVAQDHAKRAGRSLNVEARELTDNLHDVGGGSRDTAGEIRKMRRDLDNAAAAAIGLDQAMDDLSDGLYGSRIRVGELAQAKQDLNEILENGPESQSSADLAIYNGLLAEAQQRVFDLEMQMAQRAGPEAFRDWLLEQKRILRDELNPELAEQLRLLLQINAAQLPHTSSGRRAGTAATNPGPTTAPTSPSTSSTITVPRGALPTFAEGGTVPGPTGSPQLILAHGGEEVTPVGRSPAGGPVTIVLQLNGRELGRALLEELDFQRSRGTFVPK